MKLTKKQLDVIRVINDYHIDYSYSPTQSEIAEKLGVTQQAINLRLKSIKKTGLIKIMVKRSPIIIDWKMYQEWVNE